MDFFIIGAIAQKERKHHIVQTFLPFFLPLEEKAFVKFETWKGDGRLMLCIVPQGSDGKCNRWATFGHDKHN